MSSRSLMRLARHSLSSLSRGQEGAVSVISQQRQQQGSEGGQGRAWCGGAGLSLALVGIKLQAEEEKKNTKKTTKAFGDMQAEGEVLDIVKEDKIRQHSPIDTLFDYFSSYQMIDNKGKEGNNKNWY